MTTDAPTVCPECGYEKFTRLKPLAPVSLRKDFVCRRCLHRIPATTPRWAAIVLLAVGALLFVAGACLILAQVLGPWNLFSMGIGWVLALMGLVPALVGAGSLYGKSESVASSPIFVAIVTEVERYMYMFCFGAVVVVTAYIITVLSQ